MHQARLRLRDHLLYHTFRGLLAVGGLTPFPLLKALGVTLGRVALSLAARDRRRAVEHLEIAFPDLDGGQRREILAANARHFGLMFAEVIRQWSLDLDRLPSICTLSGEEHLEACREGGRGAILATAHCGNWELGGCRVASAGWPLTYPVRAIYDPRLDRVAFSLRTRCGAEIVSRGLRAGKRLVAALAASRFCALLIDQDIGDIPGVFVPFFGRPAWTPVGAARLALKMRSPMVPMLAHRRPDGGHHVDLHPPLPWPTSGSDEERAEALTAAATAVIEDHIRRYPEQWVWHHRRWRTHPPTDAA